MGVTSILLPIKIRDVSVFPFSFQQRLDEALNNVIVCLMISQKLHIKVAYTS